MPRFLIWLASGLVTAGITVLVLCPATWIAGHVESATDGRLTLGDAAGTIWSGSAFVGGAPGRDEPLMPLVPGRFSWRLSPAVLLGRVDLELRNPDAMKDVLSITGSWSRWHLSPGAITLSADRLVGLGAPMNTIRVAGRLRLSWGPLEVARENGTVVVNGNMDLEADELSSRLSPVKPLGAYRLTMLWQGREASITLGTIKGPMLLSGSGGLSNGHWQFSGRAEAEPGYDKDLANFLNLMGESRREGDKVVIALQFK